MTVWIYGIFPWERRVNPSPPALTLKLARGILMLVLTSRPGRCLSELITKTKVLGSCRIPALQEIPPLFSQELWQAAGAWLRLWLEDFCGTAQVILLQCELCRVRVGGAGYIPGQGGV